MQDCNEIVSEMAKKDACVSVLDGDEIRTAEKVDCQSALCTNVYSNLLIFRLIHISYTIVLRVNVY